MAEAAIKKPTIEQPTGKSLRATPVRKFSPSSLQEAGHDFAILAIRVPDEWDYQDTLKPEAWANVAQTVAKDALNTRRDKIGSLIYLYHNDFQAIMIIKGITKDNLGGVNGLVVKPFLKV